MLASRRDDLFILFNSANSITFFSLYNMYGESRSPGSTLVLVRVKSSSFCNFVRFLCFQPYPSLPHTLFSTFPLDFIFHLVVIVDKFSEKEVEECTVNSK